jgi:hypothetical protein
VGKLLPDDLYVHRIALDALEPLLRIYEGCGRAYLGDVEGANVIKIHRRSGKLSYLVYPEFDDAPHPALLRSIRVNLRTRQIDGTDYAQSANPPVLHRKDSFLAPDHPPSEDHTQRLYEDANAPAPPGRGGREGRSPHGDLSGADLCNRCSGRRGKRIYHLGSGNNVECNFLHYDRA